MLSKAFVVAVVLPILVLIAMGYGLSAGLRRLHTGVQQSWHTLERPQQIRPDGQDHPAGSLNVRSAPSRAAGFSSHGRRLYDPAGRRWRPRGGELLQASVCGDSAPRPNLTELMAQADHLLADGVNLVRIPVEPWQNAGAWSHPDDITELQALVTHVVNAPHTAVMLSAAAPMGTSAGADDLPRQLAFWREVVEVFAQQPSVIFDLSLSQLGGELEADDATVAFNTHALLQEIRATERAFGAPMHLVAVQGNSPRKNSRSRDYYQGSHLPAAKMGNVVWVGQRPSYVLRRPGSLYLTPVR